MVEVIRASQTDTKKARNVCTQKHWSEMYKCSQVGFQSRHSDPEFLEILLQAVERMRYSKGEISSDGHAMHQCIVRNMNEKWSYTKCYLHIFKVALSHPLWLKYSNSFISPRLRSAALWKLYILLHVYNRTVFDIKEILISHRVRTKLFQEYLSPPPSPGD